MGMCLWERTYTSAVLVSLLLPRQLYRLSYECSFGDGSWQPIWRVQRPLFAAEKKPGPETKTIPENSPYPLANRIFRVAGVHPQENSILLPKNKGLETRYKIKKNWCGEMLWFHLLGVKKIQVLILIRA